MINLDKMDRQILLELDKNSRQSFSKLAKKLKTSKSVLTYRVKRLEKLGIIKGYYTIIDTSRLGYYHFRIYLKLKETSNQKKQELMDYLVKSKKTWWVATTSYPYDVATIMVAKNLHEFNSNFNEFLKKFQKNLHSHKVKLYVELNHFYRDYLSKKETDPKREMVSIGDEDRVKLSKNEFNILKKISMNSRLGSVICAKQLKISPITVKNIIVKLKNSKIIKGFRLLLDYEKLGLEYYRLSLKVNDFNQSQDLLKFMSTLPQTVYIDHVVGGSSVEVGLQVKKEDGIQSILTKIFTKFSDSITNYEYFQILENKKVSYMVSD